MGGTLTGPNNPFRGVSTDTRFLSSGELFFALKGENFDAHEFLDQAVEKGASGLVTERDFDTAIDCIRVTDCEKALAVLARDWRSRFDLPLVAITGSNGKTTVKEMITAILAEQGHVSSTKGNLNNHIGVPLTLLSLSADHDFAVTELGANHVGEIRSLSELARTDDRCGDPMRALRTSKVSAVSMMSPARKASCSNTWAPARPR